LKIGKLASEADYTFSIYTKNFFVYDVCPYIESRRLRDKSYTRGWAKAQRNLLERRIMPEFGNLDIREIYGNRIEAWLFTLKREGTGAKTLNHLITILRLIFGQAMRNHDTEENPMEHIELFALKAGEKGILSRDELQRLFQNDAGSKWESKLHFALNLMAAATGMRLGELLALKYEMLGHDCVTVAHSWGNVDKLKSTKNGRIRRIPISASLYRLIHSIHTNGRSEGFIFSANGSRPIDHKTVYKFFYRALERIGIDREQRKNRNITFHSYRHGFNTMLLESGLAPETVRLLTGHSAGMTTRYSHVQLTNVKYRMAFALNDISEKEETENAL